MQAKVNCFHLNGYMALIKIEQDGVKRKTSGSFYRGSVTNFYPTDISLTRDNVIPEYVIKGLVPSQPCLNKDSGIIAFGSCFASEIRRYLTLRNFNVLTKAGKSYITQMGDGIVNTFSILQQFEWAWENKVPLGSYWHGYSAESFGYDESIRLETKALFDAADCFIITLGLSEIWYDEVTNEVFWRAVPKKSFDESRHKFRISTVEENYNNLIKIHRLIREHRPQASIVVTLSPIPLTATFRPISCVAANSVSKAILRVAVDSLLQEVSSDKNCFYFPSYEIVTCLFQHPWLEDRRHVYRHVLNLNMTLFERYFCVTGITDSDLLNVFREAQLMDQTIARAGNNMTPEVDARIKELETARLERIKARFERKRARMEISASQRAAAKASRIADRRIQRKNGITSTTKRPQAETQ